jgi:hypothetical protein
LWRKAEAVQLLPDEGSFHKIDLTDEEVSSAIDMVAKKTGKKKKREKICLLLLQQQKT